MNGEAKTPVVTVSIDTEEDGWGTYSRIAYSVENIRRLTRLQDLFETYGVRPTYLVNLPPLTDADSVRVLADLATREGVEIGAQCHSWNTPPFSERHEADVESDERQSLMSSLPLEVNREKVRTLKAALQREIDVQPTSFRAGRWGYGPTVSRAIAEEGFLVDASVTPFLDWSEMGGPDYSEAPFRPYRFDPERPFQPDPRGTMVELPTTVGFLSGHPAASGQRRSKLEKSVLGRSKLVGALDRMGFLARRWLSPEASTTRELLQLSRTWVDSGGEVLAFTFHSPTLLPGATPFVRDESGLNRFLERIEGFLRHCVDQGFGFATLTEVAQGLMAEDDRGDRA